MGLSPCVWGHPFRTSALTLFIGSIPMCMGPPRSWLARLSRARVYPHVYGATCKFQKSKPYMEGLSPCVWGHRSQAFDQLVFSGSIPMCMGPPIVPVTDPTFTGVYPHVYGATFDTLNGAACTSGLSPCVWGHLWQLTERIETEGSIPMCMRPRDPERLIPT